VGLPHRTWLEPLVLVASLPSVPRLTMMADAPTVVGSWWRRSLARLVGGVLLVPRRAAGGARGFGQHVTAVGRVLEAGAIFSVFPEVGPPARPPAFRRVSPAVAYFALRTGRPLVPAVFGGTHDLFLRRPVALRFLAPIEPPRPAPPHGSAAERAAADRLIAELLERATPVAAELHEETGVGVGARRRWRWLQGGFPRHGEAE